MTEKAIPKFEDLAYSFTIQWDRLLKLIETLKECPAKYSMDFILELTAVSQGSYKKHLADLEKEVTPTAEVTPESTMTD